MEKKQYRQKDPMRGILPKLPNEVMEQRFMRVKYRGDQLAREQLISRNKTTFDWRNAVHVANGDFGASIHGYPDNLTFHFAKNDIWWDDYEDEPAVVDYGIDGIRERVMAGDYTVNLDTQAASANQRHSPHQTSAGRLTLHLCSGGTFTKTEEKMDLSRGTATYRFAVSELNGAVCGENFEVFSYCDHVDQVLGVKLTPGFKNWGRVGMDLTRDPMEGLRLCQYDDKFPRTQLLQMEKDYSPAPFVLEGGYYGFTMRLRSENNPDDRPVKQYTVMMTASDPNFHADLTQDRVIVTGRPEDGPFTMFMTVVTTFDAVDTVAEAKKRLNHAAKIGFDTLYYNNDNWWNEYWNRSWIKLPQTVQAQPWYWGLYVAATARQPGKVAPGYFAPWFSGNYADWGFHILTYEQTKSNLGLLSTNHAELLEPWFSLITLAAPKIKAFTESFYHLDGLCYPHAITMTGEVMASTPDLNKTIMNLSTSGEAVKYLWDYYEFTGDWEFLKTVGYPLLKEVAKFYQGYLLTEEQGKKVIFPSRYQEYAGAPHRADDFARNTIIDICIFKLILNSAAKAASLLQIDSNLQAEWLDSAKKLPEYSVWPDGTWKPFEDCENQNRNYGSPTVYDLCPVNLSGEVDLWRGSEEMRTAALKTIKKLIAGRTCTWDMSFGMIAALRFGDKELAARVLKMLPKLKEGGNIDRIDAVSFVDDDTIAPDGQYSFWVEKGAAYLSEVITEMLLQSQGGIIRVFPAFPDGQTVSFFSLRARGAFLVSSDMREGEIQYVLIHSIMGNTCTVSNPFGEKLSIRNLYTEQTICFELKAYYAVFKTNANHLYVIESVDRPLEEVEIIES